MYSKNAKIMNRTGLHARPATDFVRKAATFKSKIMIQRVGAEQNVGNAKSIVILLTLGLSKGTEVIISAEGEDEKEAVDSLVELIHQGFGEL